MTQSALKLEQVSRLSDAVGALADLLIARLPQPAFYSRTLLPVMRAVQKFRDQQYVDLLHFARLITALTDEDAVRQAAEEVASWLDPASPNSVIVGARLLTLTDKPTTGGNTTRHLSLDGEGETAVLAHGLSIYVPFLGSVSPAYTELEFARRCGWAKFLQTFAES